ncbi:MAG: hypothetical protein WA705_19295 [Candidatus Ozemobacteraceae bacterium]
MKKIISLLVVGCLLTLGIPRSAPAADSLEALKADIANQIMTPKVAGTIEQLFFALEFQLQYVEQAAHGAGLKAFNGVVDVSCVTPAIDQLNLVLDKFQNILIYRIADRTTRFRAIEHFIEARKLAVAMIHVVIEKAKDPNSPANTTRYRNAAKAFKESLGKLFQLLPK